MSWHKALALSSTLLAVAITDASAQVIGTPRAGTAAAANPPADAPPRTPAQAPVTVAVYPFGSQYNGTSEVQTALAQRGRLAFQQGGLFTILDRSAEPHVISEVARAQDPKNFASAVKLETMRGLNARYVLWGFLEQARVDPGTANGTYDARLEFTASLVDVATGASVDDEKFKVNSVVTNMGAVRGQTANVLRDCAAGRLAGWASRLGGGQRNNRPGSDGCKPADAVLPGSSSEALTRAYQNAELAMRKWADSMAVKVRGNAVPGAPAPGAS